VHWDGKVLNLNVNQSIKDKEFLQVYKLNESHCNVESGSLNPMEQDYFSA